MNIFLLLIFLASSPRSSQDRIDQYHCHQEKLSAENTRQLYTATAIGVCSISACFVGSGCVGIIANPIGSGCFFYSVAVGLRGLITLSVGTVATLKAATTVPKVKYEKCLKRKKRDRRKNMRY